MPEIEASFLYPFSYALGEGGHIAEELFGCFGGVVCCQPPLASPFLKPLTKVTRK